MPTISPCPRCQKDVSIPIGIDLAASVRCPLCGAEYPLGEALPPGLIPVAVKTDHAQVSAAAVAAEHETAVRGGEEEEFAIGHEENEAAAVTAGQARFSAMAVVRGRRPASASPLKRLIEVVTGGLAGLLVAYYGLAIWFGPEFKKFGFPQLPGTVWLTTPSVEAGGAGEEPALEKPVQGKPGSSDTLPTGSDAGKEPTRVSPEPLSPLKQPKSSTSAKGP